MKSVYQTRVCGRCGNFHPRFHSGIAVELLYGHSAKSFLVNSQPSMNHRHLYLACLLLDLLPERRELADDIT
jgi:hypothetical protein